MRIRAKITLVCPACSQSREVSPSLVSRIRHGKCNGLCHPCASAARRRPQATRACVLCSITFERASGTTEANWAQQRYCSNRCKFAAMVKTEAPECRKGHGPKVRRQSGSRTYKCRECDRLRIKARARALGVPTRDEAARAAQKPNAGYSAIHMWLRRHHKKTGTCEECGRHVGAVGQGGTHWAYLGEPGRYERDRSQYAERCPKCHARMDRARRQAA